MIREISKNSRGVTLVALMIAVIIILILTNVVTFNFRRSIKTTKLENMRSDIANLREKVAEYYTKYGTIPISVEYTNIDHIKESGVISETLDTGKFYVLELSKLENLMLNFGQDYKQITKDMTTEEANEYKDLYIINETSHNIFYVYGIELNKDWYYTDYTQESTDTSTVDLKYVDNVKIPEGYTYISGNKDTGIKISDDKDNQFIWIPAENYNDFIGEETESSIEEITDAEMKKMYASVKSNKGFYISISDNIDISDKNETSDTIVTKCYEPQLQAIERWISNNSSREKTINYVDGKMEKRMALCLTNDEKWSSTYQGEDGTELKYIDKYENEVYIPNGFQVSLQEGSNKVNEGLVIKNATTEDRYVWIPVPKSVFKIAENEEDYKNIEADLKKYTNKYNETKPENNMQNDSIEEINQNVSSATEENVQDAYIQNEEPSETIMSEENAGYADEYSKESGFENEEEYNELKNKMLSSIYTKGGFWISQYEIGSNTYAKTDDDATERIPSSKQGQYAYNYVELEDAQKIATNIESEEKTSSLLFGIQWDLTCKFIEENDKKDVMESASWGNYKDSTFTLDEGEYIETNYLNYNKIEKTSNKEDKEILLTTGITARNETLNIYDFAGNVAEWTLEKRLSDDSLVVRGGSYQDENCSATNRNTGSNSQAIGFRIALY